MSLKGGLCLKINLFSFFLFLNVYLLFVDPPSPKEMNPRYLVLKVLVRAFCEERGDLKEAFVDSEHEGGVSILRDKRLDVRL